MSMLTRDISTLAVYIIEHFIISCTMVMGMDYINKAKSRFSNGEGDLGEGTSVKRHDHNHKYEVASGVI